MENKLRYTLGKNEKLKSRKLIEQLFKSGKSFSVFPFRVVYLLAENQVNESLVQVGFSASTRFFKKAVDRNRVKRLTREAYRLQKHQLTSSVQGKKIFVFFIYNCNEIFDQEKVSAKLKITLERLQKIINENNKATI